MPWTGSDCCGKTHCFGMSTGLSENSPDAIKAGHAFLLSSVVSMGADADECIDDVDDHIEEVSHLVCCCDALYLTSD